MQLVCYFFVILIIRNWFTIDLTLAFWSSLNLWLFLLFWKWIVIRNIMGYIEILNLILHLWILSLIIYIFIPKSMLKITLILIYITLGRLYTCLSRNVCSISARWIILPLIWLWRILAQTWGLKLMTSSLQQFIF